MIRFLLLSLGSGLLGFALAAAPTGFPFGAESLHYSIVWPSGLSLGEATLTASPAASAWHFELNVDASLPGFPIQDHYLSTASDQLCSATFERQTLHGARKAKEIITVASDGRATRQTPDGGSSSLTVSPCAHDALTFLYFARRALGQGKLVPAETVLFGAGYPVRLEYAGPQQIALNGSTVLSDKVVFIISRHNDSDLRTEMFFAQDPARTPLLVRSTFTLGTFTMELVR